MISISKSTFGKFMLVAAATGFLLGYFFIHQFAVPAEPALRLTEGALIAEGKVPYIDFLDNVPPFYLYLNLLPVGISSLSHCHPILALNILMAIYFALCGVLVVLLGRLPSRRNPLTRAVWPLLAAFVLVTLGQLAQFSEPNQFLFLGLTPYVLCRALSARGVPVPRELATAIGATLCPALVIDPFFCYLWLAFEFCVLAGFWPFAAYRFTLKRFLGVEFKIAVYVMALLFVYWLLVQNESTERYLGIITKINDLAQDNPILPLCFFDTCTDTRRLIYLAVLLLVIAIPQARRSLPCRYLAVVSLLGFGLMMMEGATLAYQSYIFVGFAALALAASLDRQPLLRRIFDSGGQSIGKLLAPLVPAKPAAYLPSIFLVLGLTAAGTCFWEGSHMAPGDRYDLHNLGYYGTADRRDLGILSEVIEQYSKVKEPVAILTLGVRPAYPVLTQLRRRPGFTLTWGFPIDVLNILDEPRFGNEVKPLKEFKPVLYLQMINEISELSSPPVLVLVDEDEVKRTLAEQGVTKALDEHYNLSGMASIKAPDAQDGHPPLEYVGYRAALDIYRKK